MDAGAATPPSSRIFQDLVNLEKDFKYNLSLLKIKDTEIERCTITNKTLQESLKTKLSEIETLKEKVSNLESTLQNSEHELECEKAIYQQTVAKLTEQLKEMTQKHQDSVEESKNEVRQKHTELEKVYAKVLAQKETDFQHIINTLEERLQNEACATSKAKSQLEALADENMSLRNQVRQLESQYTSETYFYKTEFKTLQSASSNLNSEIERLKEGRTCLEEKLAKIAQENDNMQTELLANNERISNLIKQNNDRAVENNQLKQHLQERENLYKELALNNDHLTQDKTQLEAQYKELKQIVSDYSSSTYCNVPDHGNHDVLVRQNGVLQELVRGMRKDRERAIAEHSETERRVEKLEELMRVIKKQYA